MARCCFQTQGDVNADPNADADTVIRRYRSITQANTGRVDKNSAIYMQDMERTRLWFQIFPDECRIGPGRGTAVSPLR